MALPSLSQAKGPGQARGRAQQVPESTQGLEQLQGWGTAVGSALPQRPSWCMARKAGPSSLALAGGAQMQASSGRGMPCWDPNTPGSQWQGCLPAVPGVRQCRTQELAGPVSSLDEHLVAERTHEHCLLLSLWGRGSHHSLGDFEGTTPGAEAVPTVTAAPPLLEHREGGSTACAVPEVVAGVALAQALGQAGHLAADHLIFAHKTIVWEAEVKIC